MRNRVFSGLSLVEVVIAVALLTLILLSTVSVFVSARRDAQLTRQELEALIVAENTLAEVQDHVFGTPPPSHWGSPETGPDVIVRECLFEGAVTQDRIKRLVTSQTGAFFGKSQGTTDRVTITVWWQVPRADGESEERNESFSIDVRPRYDLSSEFKP